MNRSIPARRSLPESGGTGAPSVGRCCVTAAPGVLRASPVPVVWCQSCKKVFKVFGNRLWRWAVLSVEVTAGFQLRLGGFDARCPAPSPPPRPASRHPAALHPVSPSLVLPHLPLFNPSSSPVAGASLQKMFLGPDGVSRFFPAPSPRSPMGLPRFFFLFCVVFVFARCSPCPSSPRKRTN